MDDGIKIAHDPLMRVGIGTKEHAAALTRLGCKEVWAPDDFRIAMEGNIKPLRARDDDVIVVVDPKILALPTINEVVKLGVSIEVAGHEPTRPRTYDERRALRAMVAKVEGEPVIERRGRPRVYDVAEAHIIEAIKEWFSGEYVEGKWRSEFTPAGVMERVRMRTGLKDLPDHWAKNVMRTRFGKPIRNPADLEPKYAEVWREICEKDEG